MAQADRPMTATAQEKDYVEALPEKNASRELRKPFFSSIFLPPKRKKDVHAVIVCRNEHHLNHFKENLD
jgi:hypothetical protein